MWFTDDVFSQSRRRSAIGRITLNAVTTIFDESCPLLHEEAN
jgi:hypothetical protein